MSRWVSQSGPCPAFIEGTHSGGWSQHLSTGSIIAYGAPGQLAPGWTQSKTNPDLYKVDGSNQSPRPSPVQCLSSHCDVPDEALLRLRDKVLRYVLSAFSLSDAQTSRLLSERYGLGRKCVESIGYVPDGWQQKQRVVDEIKNVFTLNDEQLLRIPGFKRGKRGRVSFSVPPSYLLPFFDLEGRIRSLQARRVGKDIKDRYRWLSGGGAPVGVLSKDSFTQKCKVERVWLTEGYFKAIAILADLAGPHDVVLYLGGINMGDREVKSIVERLRPSEVRFLPDNDWQTNVNVLRGVKKHCEALQDCKLQVWTWKGEKGIDDYLATGGPVEDIVRQNGSDFLRSLPSFKENAYLKGAVNLPTKKALSKSEHWTQQDLTDLTKEAFDTALAAPSGTLTIHDGDTGTGKSTHYKQVCKPGDIVVTRNWSTGMEFFKGWEGTTTLLPLMGRQKPPVETSTQEERERFERAGCKDWEEASQRAALGYKPCHGCPLAPEQGETECQYWKQRLEARAKAPRGVTLTTIRSLEGEKELLDGKRVVLDDLPLPDLLDSLARPGSLNAAQLQGWIDALEELESKSHVESCYIDFATALKAYCNGEEVSNLPELADAINPDFDFTGHLHVLDAASLSRPANYVGAVARHIQNLNTPPLKQDGELVFLRSSALCKALANSTVVLLDATADPDLLTPLFETFGLSVEVTNLPRRQRRFHQLFQKLWTGEQLSSPLAQSLNQVCQQKDGLYITLKELAEDGPYLGKDERGLNAYRDAAFTVIAGHYALPDKAATFQAWLYRSLIQWHQGTAPAPSFSVEEGKTWRTYGDPWRPCQRRMHTMTDGLAEYIKRHVYTSTVLQASARDRTRKGEEGYCFLLSGQPLEWRGQLVQVDLMTEEEAWGNLASDGFSQPEKAKRQISASMQAQNAERRTLADARVEETVKQLLATEDGVNMTVYGIQTFMGEGEGRAKKETAQRVFQQLQERKGKVEEKQLLESSERDVPTQSLDISKDIVGTPVLRKPKPLKENKKLADDKADRWEQVKHRENKPPALPPPPKWLDDSEPSKEEALPVKPEPVVTFVNRNPALAKNRSRQAQLHSLYPSSYPPPGDSRWQV